jgi:hypothetical protein
MKSTRQNTASLPALIDGRIELGDWRGRYSPSPRPDSQGPEVTEVEVGRAVWSTTG